MTGSSPSPGSLGFKAGLPIAVSYLFISVAFGALAVETHLSPAEATLMSVLVFAGASQFMALGMLKAGAGTLQIVLATLFINLRHFIMSLAVHHRLDQDTPPRGRALLSFGITDETFALLTLPTTSKVPLSSPAYALGLMGSAYAGWVGGTLLGSLGAQVIPSTLSSAMGVGLYALFIGLLIPHVRRSSTARWVTGASMVLNALLAPLLGPGWAIVAATVCGASVGLLLPEDSP